MPLSQCRRCAGRGKVEFRYGLPGQDMHKPHSEVEWDGPSRWKDCPVCLGTGWGKPEYLGLAGLKVVFDEFGRPHRTPLQGEPSDHTTQTRDQETGS